MEFSPTHEICLREDFEIRLSAKITLGKIFVKNSNSTQFQVWIKRANNAIKLFFIIHFFKYRNEQKLNIAILMVNYVKNWNGCINFQLAYFSLNLFQSPHFPLGNLKSLGTLFFVHTFWYWCFLFCDFPTFWLQVYITFWLNKLPIFLNV